MTPANMTLRLMRPDDEKHPGATQHTRPRPRTLLQRRHKILIPLAIVWLMMATLAGVLLLTGAKPSTPFGDTAAVPGGLARISAIIPLETDGWVPPTDADLLSGPVQPGAHRVRILLELAETDAAGLVFRATDYSLSGLGARSTALWVDTTERAGASVQATLVFEIPNQAIALVLEGPQAAHLSLGTGHHTGF
ncbi:MULTISPECIES: hypothetical protein [unclassified Cryobacterium]|uniref:hypothetical protein n=1 Tax=unclassified Cryobacterium TaxID=2649013 RepID=UPI001E434C9D|nr:MULTISPECIES: hypothetical protein [unclassified Cryobacterium]